MVIKSKLQRISFCGKEVMICRYSELKLPAIIKKIKRGIIMKKRLSVFASVALAVTLMLAIVAFIPVKANAATGGWYLVEKHFENSPSDGTFKSNVMGGGYVLTTYACEGSEGDMKITNECTTPGGDLVARVVTRVTWDSPPEYLPAGQKVGFNVEAETLESQLWSPSGVSATFDIVGIPTGVTVGSISFVSEDGEKNIVDKKVYFESEAPIPAGSPGDKKSIYLRLGEGYGYTYTYEWREEAPPAAPAPTTPAGISETNAEAFESGARIMWNPVSNCLGYRLYRSTSPDELGISVTDFYITSTSYADVNVEPNTTYYYTVKPVLAEAKPFEGIDEKLGDPIATFTVTTGSQIYKPGSFKHFILLKLDSPYMSVDGVQKEVDPGRGTAPVTISGRTMVPIRAIVEAMGGTADWDNATNKITLNARGNIVEMWLGKTDIKVNGASKKMDVVPVLKNERTFVPIRFAAENLNCKVDWINSTQEAVIVYEE